MFVSLKSTRIFFLAAAVHFAVQGAYGIDLFDRYPSDLADKSNQRLSWDFNESDVYALTRFQFGVNDEFRIETGPAFLGVGRSDKGAVWAIVIPQNSGVLKSEVKETEEAVNHIWIRLHPKTISELFPPDTVQETDDASPYYRMKRIASWKFPNSWHAGPLALIPPPGVYTFDIDCTDNARRFFSVDANEQSVKYYPDISKPVPFRSITRDEAEESFDLLWDEYDRQYATFVIRPEVDWNALRERYRPRAVESQTAYEFACICAEMLAHLRDLHVWVRLGNESIPVFNRPRPGNANVKAAAALLGELKDAGERVQWTVTSDKIGYIAIYSLSDRDIPKQVDKALESMLDTRGLIMDVRLNGGGSEPLGQEMTGRFIDREAIYSYSQYRNGPKHDDLTDPLPRTVKPRDEWRYDRPVVLLIGQRCLSSNESFIAMMDQCPQVTMMGDRTGGSSGNPKIVELPIGATVSLPRWLDLLADEKPLDERGIQPDVFIETKAESFIGDDPVLKAALERLQNVPLPDGPIATPTPEPTEEKESETSKPSKPQKEKKPKAPAPNVIMLDPLFASTDAPSNMEILVTFDRAMSPDKATLHWGTGGFRSIGPIELYEDIFQFVIPIHMEPGTTHKISLPPGGFRSSEDGNSAKMEWSFQTAPLEADKEAPSPQIASIEPATGSVIPRVALLRLQFDRPMAPESVFMRDVSKSQGSKAALCTLKASRCTLSEYDEETQTITVPVLFPSQWEGSIRLSNMQSRAGKPVNPVQLTYKTEDAIFSQEMEERFEETRKSEAVRALLTSTQEARKALRSFQEKVFWQSSSVPFNTGFTYFKAQSARFAIEGTTQFVADISRVMDVPFYIGNTGRRFWRYEESVNEDFLIGLLPEDVDETTIRLADPFHLLEKTVDEVLKENRLEYLEKREEKDCTAHVLRSWRIADKGEQEILCIDDYWIDADTFLPARTIRNTSDGTRFEYFFRFENINKTMPETDFAPSSVTEMPMTLEEPLSDEYNKRFLIIQDGSDGAFRVEWGKSGENSYSSVGIN